MPQLQAQQNSQPSVPELTALGWTCQEPTVATVSITPVQENSGVKTSNSLSASLQTSSA